MVARVMISGTWRSLAEVEAVLVEARTILNHPGHADQSSHGRKGMRSHARIRKTYEMTDEQTGYRTRVDAISTRDSDGVTLVDISIRDRNGEDVGWAGFEISADGKTVEHSGMELTEREFQGQGFTTRQMVHVVDSYKRSGVKELTLTANSDVGGYAWARAGFQFRGSAARSAVAAHAKARAKNYDTKTRAQIDRVANNPNASPADFAMIGRTGGSKMWPGKEIMLASTWDGILSL